MKHHATYEKFGGDAMLIRAYDHWSVLCRPAQPTRGAMVLVAHAEATAFSDLPAAAFSELHRAIGDIEAAARAAFRPDKINYLMLMMVDPHVHFHVLMRYGADRAETDPGWPGPPSLGETADVDVSAVRAALISAWPAQS